MSMKIKIYDFGVKIGSYTVNKKKKLKNFFDELDLKFD
jgi:hypothetical protein